MRVIQYALRIPFNKNVYMCYKVGNPFSFKGHFDIFNIIRGPDKIIYVNISLAYLVTL